MLLLGPPFIHGYHTQNYQLEQWVPVPGYTQKTHTRPTLGIGIEKMGNFGLGTQKL